MTFDIEKFLNTPLYAFDQTSVFGDLQEFLEFSEKNIEWQKRTELQRIAQEMATTNIEEEHRYSYERHLRDNAEFRFDTVLPMRVRYAALTSLISTIEWSVEVLVQEYAIKIPSPKNKNRVIHRLRYLTAEWSLDLTVPVAKLEFLTWVRNIIIHNSGLLKGCKYESAVRQFIVQYEPSFKISNWHFVGDTIEIQRNAIDPLISSWKDIIYELYKSAHECRKAKTSAK
jgi:hypothetical protein